MQRREISAPKQKNHDIEALFKRNLQKNHKRKIENLYWQMTLATLMHPLQYDSQLSAAKDNSIAHAAAPSNFDTTITMRFSASGGQHASLYAHGNKTWHQSCSHYSNLQPEIQQAKRTTHKWTTTRCRTQRRNRLRAERPQPQPPHTGGTFHRRLQPLYTEKHKVSCSGFRPTSAMQHSCSHHNAFCSMTWLTRMYLRTWQHEMTTIVQQFQ